MIETIVNILVAVVLSLVIGTVLGFAVSPILAVAGVINSESVELSLPGKSIMELHGRWIDYWVEWELRHRDE